MPSDNFDKQASRHPKGSYTTTRKTIQKDRFAAIAADVDLESIKAIPQDECNTGGEEGIRAINSTEESMFSLTKEPQGLRTI